MAQLRGPTAGDAADDRARRLSFRHQLPRIRGGRHRGRRRHRRDAQHGVRPLRIRFRSSYPADHHRHRDADGIFVGLPSPLGAVMAVELPPGTKVWHHRERGAQFTTWTAWLPTAPVFVYLLRFISDKTILVFSSDAPAHAAV